MSLLSKLGEAQAALVARRSDHPWKLSLERVRGTVDYDGIERVSTQKLLDLLEVPMNRRNTATYRALSKLMAELGWTPVRVRDLTRGGYKEQVRGYARDAKRGSAEGRR